jgi:hypothetical protein
MFARGGLWGSWGSEERHRHGHHARHHAATHDAIGGHRLDQRIESSGIHRVACLAIQGEHSMTLLKHEYNPRISS